MLDVIPYMAESCLNASQHVAIKLTNGLLGKSFLIPSYFCGCIYLCIRYIDANIYHYSI